MTVTTQTKKVTAAGNGSSFTFSFSPIVIFASTDLEVVTTVTATGVETARTEGVGSTNWSTDITTFPATGSITYPADEGTAHPSTETITIKRVLTLEQQTDLNNQGGYFPEVQETQFDKLVMIDLQQQDDLDRGFKLPISDATGVSTDIPSPVGAGGKVWAWNSGLTAIEYMTPNTSAYLTTPSSATDNAVVRFDGTTGSSFQNSGVTVDDNDLLTAVGGLAGNKGADIASATALVIGTDGDRFDVTGTTTVTSMTTAIGRYFTLQFDGAVLLTNGASLVLPGAANITTAAGDRFTFVATAANTVECISYARASGLAIAVDADTLFGDVQNTFTKAQVPSTSTAALSASSGVLDYDTYTNFIITLASGSNTLAAPTTEASQIGQCGVIIFIQPSSSSAGTLSLHGDYETAGAAGITLSTTNSAYDVVPYIVKADNSVLLGAPQLAFG